MNRSECHLCERDVSSADAETVDDATVCHVCGLANQGVEREDQLDVGCATSAVLGALAINVEMKHRAQRSARGAARLIANRLANEDPHVMLRD